MAQSSRGAHEEPFVGRSRRPNRNATQRREQARRATARFVIRVLRMASMTHRGFTVGGELAEPPARLGSAPGMLPVSRLRGPSSSNDTFAARASRSGAGGRAGPTKRGPGEAAYGSGAYRGGAGEVL